VSVPRKIGGGNRLGMSLAALVAAWGMMGMAATATSADAPPKQDPGPWGPPGDRRMSPRDFGMGQRYNQRKARKHARNGGVHPANPKRR
jgi:hypothetical protein